MPKTPRIPRTPARRAAVFLACAAAFTFVAAQYPWEPSPASGSDAGPSLNSAEEPKFESYDIGPYSSSKGDGSGEKASKGADSKKKASAKPPKPPKPPKEKKPKAARVKSSGPSFSAAFSGPQKSCPVCGSARLKGNLYVDCDGKRIHVCSAACIGRVRRNPAAFADILIKRGEQLAPTP
jgi:hypothetical protein